MLYIVSMYLIYLFYNCKFVASAPLLLFPSSAPSLSPPCSGNYWTVLCIYESLLFYIIVHLSCFFRFHIQGKSQGILFL